MSKWIGSNDELDKHQHSTDLWVGFVLSFGELDASKRCAAAQQVVLSQYIDRLGDDRHRIMDSSNHQS